MNEQEQRDKEAAEDEQRRKELRAKIEADPELTGLVQALVATSKAAMPYARDGAEMTTWVEVGALFLRLPTGEGRVLVASVIDPSEQIEEMLCMAADKLRQDGLQEGESVKVGVMRIPVDGWYDDGRGPGLYWCSTEDHTADWFVVAWGSEEAATMHEDLESFDKGEADAELVCEVPEAAYDLVTEAGRPAAGLIEACGGEFLPNQGDFDCSVVKIAGNVYVEGDALAGVRNDGDRAVDKPN